MMLAFDAEQAALDQRREDAADRCERRIMREETRLAQVLRPWHRKEYADAGQFVHTPLYCLRRGRAEFEAHVTTYGAEVCLWHLSDTWRLWKLSGIPGAEGRELPVLYEGCDEGQPFSSIETVLPEVQARADRVLVAWGCYLFETDEAADSWRALSWSPQPKKEL